MARILSVLTAAGTALSNTTTETALNGALWTIAANTLQAGKTYRVAGVVRATATNSTNTLRAYLKGHTAATLAAGTAVGDSAAVDATDNDTVTFDVQFVPRSAAGSTSGTMVCTGHMSTVGAEGTVTQRSVFEILTIDYTAAYYIGLTGTWSAASASNSCQVESFLVFEES